MKAISVRQPWAWAIVDGGKDVENRTRIGTWLPAMGETVAVHATKAWSTQGASSPLVIEAWARRHAIPDGVPSRAVAIPQYLFTPSAIIGTMFVADVHPDAGCCAPWGESSYTEAGGHARRDVCHLVLEEPRLLPQPVGCAGALGLWTLPADLERDILTLVAVAE